ncbi:hypothetical protein BVRB_2g027990 [Beta vulgaris subsp. vulgaris]|uniref:uncharacterized protein LOC104906897 n=1 Tax=Beta vulgaris subsp. vulgaris TaxID=3555 RepID=UPI00053F63ED|nr:uncharacterized protein LOC104906897 [Beta vulgaris subsp. vulgaris]KMT18670.1 hypothetical protein BVRB_2g027990 [Beta vulgaris subsp. vulgaris]
MSKKGPPKHQNKFAWNPTGSRKINETEPGGRFRPFPEITGVCLRCKNQIEWKRKYGKYKPLVEPAKCQKCSKRAVRQACLNLCPGCAKEQGVCAKCCSRVDQIVGRNPAEVEAEQKMLEEAIKNARERERRTLLRAMNKDKAKPKGEQANTPTIQEGKVEGLFSAVSLEEYAELSRDNEDDDDDEGDEDNVKVCN